MSAISHHAGRLPRRLVPALRAWNLILLVVLIALGVAAYFALRTTSQAATTTPRTSAVARGVVLASVSASGSVATRKDLSVGFETSGRVVSVDVKAGEQVARGDVLGRLDQTDARASLKQAEASLASAKASLLQTQSGETAAQRKADAISLEQSRAQVRQAQTSLASAKAQQKADDRSTNASIASAQSSLSVKPAQTQLKTDQGSLRAAAAKLKADKAKLTVNGRTYANADEAVSAWTNVVNQDKESQQAQTQANYDLQAQQTLDQQQLSSDQSSLQSASAADKPSWQSKVAADQDKVDYDSVRLQQQQRLLNQIQYQLSQDQATLQTVQTLQTTLSQDQASIVSYEAKIVSDRNQIATAKSQRQSQIQTAKSTRVTTLAKDRQSIVSAQQQVASAQLAVKSAVANNATKAYVSPATLAQSRAQVVQAQATLASARRTLAETVLRAPASGTVSKVNGIVGQSVSGSGSSANSTASSSGTGSSTGSTSSNSSSSAFVELVDLGGMQVTASFSESDAAKIRLGQAGTVTVSALPNQELAAHVIAIDVAGTSSSGVVQYTVTLGLDRMVAGLKPGMSANATVTTSERDNVLNVPNAAVTGTGSNARVTVVRTGQQQTVNVVAGLKGDSNTEIVSGLKVGDQVVTSTGVTATTGSTSNTNPFGGRGGLGGGLGGGGLPGGGFPRG
ncbi:MAG: efflux RND transporter periplasmic adaptor subunit [Gaiellaceae bacterium]